MVVISNGHNKFILGTAAAEANKRNILDGYITAGYPNKYFRTALAYLASYKRSGKLVNSLLSRKEQIPDDIVHPMWISEVLWLLDRSTSRIKSLSEYISIVAMKQYGNAAVRIISNIDSRIYHYRAGYGQNSVKAAKQKGMIAVCDHSLAHPSVLQHLIDNNGRLPQEGDSISVSYFWSSILADIEQADHVIVNSDFVKETFLNQNYPDKQIHVVYTGIDNQFIEAVPARKQDTDLNQPIKLMFAGDFGPRKGAHILIEALSNLYDLPWLLEIIGTIDPAIRHKYVDFFNNERVTLTGSVKRLELAERMSIADVFLFPSLAEGSARVVFMAMACGCYVITTPNSGSVVIDGINGSLIPPGNSIALETAIRTAHETRDKLNSVGQFNAGIIRSRYKQSDYGDALFDVYNKIIELHRLDTQLPHMHLVN